MSGAEPIAVAGLVLGAIPLAISAYEHWRGAAERIDRLASFEKHYKRVSADLEDERVLFRLHIAELIGPLVYGDVVKPSELDRIIENTHDPLWASQDVAEAIKDRLGPAYDNYVRVLGEIEGDCMKLLKQLKFDVPEVAAGDQSAMSATQKLMDNTRRAFVNFNIVFEAERLSFAFAKVKHDAYVQRIRENNEKLSKFLASSSKVAASRQGATPNFGRLAAQYLLQYWRSAERLHDLLRCAWGCKCREQHCARLWLQHRNSPAFEFRLWVLFSPTSAGTNVKYAWQQQSLKIEKVKRSLTGQLVVPTVPSSVQAQSSPATQPGRKGLLNRVKVKFSTHRGVHQVAKPAPTVPTVHGPSMVVNVPTPTAVNSPITNTVLAQITHLCDAMSSCGVQARSIGALNDATLDQAYSVLVQSEPPVSSDSTALLRLLQRSYQPRLSRRQTYRLALVIASSHLQLQSTPWALKVWTATDIHFPLSKQGPLLDRPYVSAEFKDPLVAQGNPVVIPDRSFAALGIMLLELCSREPIEDSVWWQQLGFDNGQKQHTLFRHVVAQRWAENIEDEEGIEMASAIKWCLNESPKSLEGEQWRRDLADRVVLPIQNCCNHLERR